MAIVADEKGQLRAVVEREVANATDVIVMLNEILWP
jgi:hypothetical protein